MKKQSCIPALKALGEEVRLRILRVLAKQPLSVGEVAAALEITPYNASKHLTIMRNAGLLDCTRDGNAKIYSIPQELKAKKRNGVGELDLGCCSFKFDELPR